MKQLLEDAEKISGVHYDMSSYADIIDALQIIQDEQHITGNAAEEASKTIGGSINTLKASWSNMVTAMTDPNADPRVVFVQLTEAAQNVINNVAPFVQNVLQTLTTMAPVMLTQIVSMINDIATNMLPPLLEAVFSLLTSIGESIMSNIDVIIDVIFTVIGMLASYIANNAGKIVESIVTIITKIINKITENMPAILKTVGKILLEVAKALIKAIPDLAKSITEMFVSLGKNIWDNRHLIVDKFKEVFLSAKDAIMEAAAGIWNSVKSLFHIGKDDVTVDTTGHNAGLYEVPYDGYMTRLHKGERVLTQSEAMAYNKKEDTSSVVQNTFNITVPANNNAMDTALRLRDLTRKETYGYVC